MRLFQRPEPYSLLELRDGVVMAYGWKITKDYTDENLIGTMGPSRVNVAWFNREVKAGRSKR